VLFVVIEHYRYTTIWPSEGDICGTKRMDGDVDGLDLAGTIEAFDPSFDLAKFALEFGRIDCF
jgi:hypothetical protein